jgi:hypothetical protein
LATELRAALALSARMSHEDLSRGSSGVELGSDRWFGLVISVALAIIGVLPLRHGEPPHLWALLCALVFAALAMLAPNRLRPLNKLWFKLGTTLHKITNPIIMGVVFFGVLVPVSIIFRMRGIDPLGLSFDRGASSYWHVRKPCEGQSIDMRKQF